MKVEIVDETIVGEVEIDAPPEAVFDALTDPAQLAAWWGSDDTYRTSNWKIDPRPGGAWSCEARAAAGGDISTVHGVYLELDRPRAIAYTWNPSWEKTPETQVRFHLEPSAAGTRVRLTHAGFAGYQGSRDRHAQGWTRVLGWLGGHFGGKAAAAKEGRP